MNRYRQLLTTVLAVLAVGILGLGGSMLRPEAPAFDPGPPPVVGRTGSVCAISTTTQSADTEIGAVAIRKAPGREGTLTGTAIDAKSSLFTVTEQGRGKVWTKPKVPVVLEGEGVMATASAGAVVGSSTSGDDRGLMAAPCAAPATEHWFVGVGADSDHRSEVVLTNSDESQAEVDLRFYGPKGIVVVPGSPGVVIPAGTSRTVAVDSLVESAGPLTVVVRASTGRVSAMVLDRTSNKLDPTGSDWHAASTPPGNQVFIPGVPEGNGRRALTVVNPGTDRALVNVEVLDAQGTYAPAGAEQLEIPPESTGQVDLSGPLAGVPVAVKLTSDLPVTGSVISTSTRDDADPDMAIEAASAPVLQTGVAGYALLAGAESMVVLSNGGTAEVTLALELLNYDGVSLRKETVVLGPGTTDTRRITQMGSGYLVVNAPDGALVYAGLVLSDPDGPVAGLATSQLVSPDVASRAPEVTPDPMVGG